MPPTVIWETVFTLYRDGKQLKGEFHDFWQNTTPITEHTQETFWKRIYTGYSIGSFSCHKCTGSDPKPCAFARL